MIVWLRRLTVERAARGIVFALLFAMACRVSIDPDMWWHLALGQRSLDTGEFVYVDAYSHTRNGVVHKNHSGLGQLLLIASWLLAGHFGLTLFVALLATAGMYFLHRASVGSIYMRGFVLIFGAACAAAFWAPRPQMFTFVFSALLILLLSDLKHRRRDRLWLLPPLLWLWANLHGGYIVAYLFIGAFVLGEWLNAATGLGQAAVGTGSLRKLLLLTAFSFVLLPFHPLGFGVFAAPFETLSIQGLRNFIQEWQSPDLRQPITWGFLILLGMLPVAFWGGRRRLDATEWLLVGGALASALFAARHLPLFAIVAVPIICKHFDELLKRRAWALPHRSCETTPRALLNLFLIVLVSAGAAGRLFYLTSPATVKQATAINWPVGAVDYLNRAGLTGNLFNSYNWGGYLLFYAPRHPVFIDGRTDLYRDFLAEYHSAVDGSSSWGDVFAKWRIDIALIESAGALARQLAAHPNWRIIYRDPIGSIFLRAESQSKAADP